MKTVLPMGAREKALLGAMPFMKPLTGEACHDLIESATSIRCEARDIIFRQHEPSDYFYCVLSGFVRLYRRNKDGREADIRICGPGDTFAECVLYTADGSYRYNAQATETSLLGRFETRAVRLLAERNCEIDKAMVGVVASHLLDSIDCLANDRLQTAPQRVANYLLDACNGSENAQLRLPFPKSLLAGKLGLAPEALSRAFSTLRNSGVTVHGRLIEIRDPEALKNV